MKCLKFPAKPCDLLTCQSKGKCLWHDDLADNPKEPEAVHGNEAEKVVRKCRFCGGPSIIDGGICYPCHMATR